MFKLGYKYQEESGSDGTGDGGSEGDKGNKGDGNDEAMAELKTKMEEIQAENSRLTAKISEANKHAKAAEKKTAEEARKKAEAEGNYEQLFKSSEEERNLLSDQLEEVRAATSREKLTSASLKIASSISEGDNIGLLADFIQRRLKDTAEGIKVMSENGDLTVSSLDDLSKEFAGSSRFAALIKGNQSSGGGANGGQGSGSSAKEITRSDFDALDHVQRMKFVQSGGTVST